MASPANNFNVYEFEKILRHKEGHYGTLYLVKWKGYSDKHNSWEPQQSFVPQDIENYMERLKQNLLKRIDKSEAMAMQRKADQRVQLEALEQKAKDRDERKQRRDMKMKKA